MADASISLSRRLLLISVPSSLVSALLRRYPEARCREGQHQQPYFARVGLVDFFVGTVTLAVFFVLRSGGIRLLQSSCTYCGMAYSAAVLSILKFVDIDATVYLSAPDPL